MITVGKKRWWFSWTAYWGLKQRQNIKYDFLADLEERFACEVLKNGTTKYYGECIIWNFFIQAQPLAIILVESEEDIKSVLQICLENEIQFTIRSG